MYNSTPILKRRRKNGDYTKSLCRNMYFQINPDRGSQSELLVRVISEREPLKIECNHIATYFRYFDITEAILDDGEILYEKRKNYSPMYYYGKRLNKKDIKELGIFWENFCREKGIDSIIQCYNGDLITNPSEGSITIDELKVTKKENKIKTIKIKNI